MQLLTILSSLALLTTSVVALPDPLSFVRWPCADCNDSQTCRQQSIAPKQSEECYPLPETRGLKIYEAKPNCEREYPYHLPFTA